MCPAPITTACRPSSPPSASAPRSAPAATNTSGAAPTPVSDRTRRPVLTAALNAAASDGPVARSPSARRSASRTCERICGSPSTIESSPLATVNRCSAASDS